MPIITTPPPSPSTTPSPASSLSRPLLHSFPSSTSTYTYASTTTSSSPPSTQQSKHPIGDPYAPLLLHTPNPHSYTNSKPKRPPLSTHTSSFERLFSKILPTINKSSQLEIKPRRAATPRMKKRGSYGNGANGTGYRDEEEEEEKEKVAIFELEFPLEVSRDKTEIDYLRRIQSEHFGEGDGGSQRQGEVEGDVEGDSNGKGK